MATTNDELKRILQEQGGETNTRLLSIETHLARLNGSVTLHEQRLDRLPCEEHGESLTVVRTLIEASMTPREQGRLEATVGAQPTGREMGRLEERQEVHETALQRIWEIGKIPIVIVVTAAATYLLSQVVL